MDNASQLSYNTRATRFFAATTGKALAAERSLEASPWWPLRIRGREGNRATASTELPR